MDLTLMSSFRPFTGETYSSLMCQYIEFVVDHLLVSLGNDKVYNETNPFDIMDMISQWPACMKRPNDDVNRFRYVFFFFFINKKYI